MIDLLPDRLPWFIAGPLLGCLIVGLFAIGNRPMGSLGAYIQTVSAVRGGAPEPWRVWFFGGMILGGFLVAILGGGPPAGLAFGALGEELSTPVLALVLLAGGLLIGFGARWAGGCTMGHGLCGTAILSRGSMVATAVFMSAAVAVSFLIHVVVGGRL